MISLLWAPSNKGYSELDIAFGSVWNRSGESMQICFRDDFVTRAEAVTQKLMSTLVMPAEKHQRAWERNLADPEIFKHLQVKILSHPLVLLESVCIPRNMWLHEDLLRKLFLQIQEFQERLAQELVQVDRSASDETSSGMTTCS